MNIYGAVWYRAGQPNTRKYRELNLRWGNQKVMCIIFKLKTDEVASWNLCYKFAYPPSLEQVFNCDMLEEPFILYELERPKLEDFYMRTTFHKEDLLPEKMLSRE